MTEETKAIETVKCPYHGTDLLIIKEEGRMIARCMCGTNTVPNRWLEQIVYDEPAKGSKGSAKGGGDAPPPDGDKPLEDLTKKELKALLAEKELSTSGNKTKLLERLLEAPDPDDDDPDDDPANDSE